MPTNEARGTKSKSTASQAFYSLVQFVPDEWRSEGVNLGVVLLSPDRQFLEWKLVDNVRRVKKMFPGSTDADRLRAMQAGLEAQLKQAQSGLFLEGQFEAFARRFRNQLQLSDPRPCLPTDPHAELSKLFLRLVETETPRVAEQALVLPTKIELSSRFEVELRRRQVFDRLEHDVRVRATYDTHEYRFAHAYQNGCYQILDEVSFDRASADRNCERARGIATVIQDVTENAALGKVQFGILASFRSDQPESRQVIQRLFQDRHVHLWTLETIEDLADKVATDLAHDAEPTP